MFKAMRHTACSRHKSEPAGSQTLRVAPPRTGSISITLTEAWASDSRVPLHLKPSAYEGEIGSSESKTP